MKQDPRQDQRVRNCDGYATKDDTHDEHDEMGRMNEKDSVL